MHIAILGAGRVGTTLGSRLQAAGHTITYGVRDPADDAHTALRDAGGGVAAIRDAVAGADAAILSTPYRANADVLAAAGDFGGKVLVDATNPIGAGMMLAVGHSDSGAETVARLATNARVVKAFNTTGVENMADATIDGRRVMMPVCGVDDDAIEVGLQLARDVGFEAVSMGPLDRARLLEPMALVWIQLAYQRGEGRGFGFGILRRSGSNAG
jgi:predicted dinucleotide-binding enzyme